jgi:hypothetical protein
VAAKVLKSVLKQHPVDPKLQATGLRLLARIFPPTARRSNVHAAREIAVTAMEMHPFNRETAEAAFGLYARTATSHRGAKAEVAERHASAIGSVPFSSSMFESSRVRSQSCRAMVIAARDAPAARARLVSGALRSLQQPVVFTG